ncbi:MAG: hypothetical protein CFE32_06520 [Alphaproteobacteria bacterium PA3]|nr:MAG: hypothetical protein CFE32_06520 [Alphaproteobacteria bacterium PA3]
MLEKIQALKEDYIASLREDFEMFEALASEIEFGLEEPRTFSELRELAHRIAGSAGSFGLDALGSNAKSVDQILTESQAVSAQLSAQLVDLRANFVTAVR